MPCGNTFLKTAIIFSGIVNNRRLQAMPAYFMLIAANALPVYGAALGKLVFFQVLYLYWFESLLLIAFDLVRIAFARGTQIPDSAILKVNGVLVKWDAARDLKAWSKLKMMFWTAFIRTALLLFYLLFIIVFIGFQVTDKTHRMDVFGAMLLRGPFMQTAIWAFVISNIVQLIAGFFYNGQYRILSPRAYQNFFSGRVIIMHVMIVGSAFIHKFLFEGKTYAATGEIVYVGLFMLMKTAMDILHFNKVHAAEEPFPMI